MSFQQKQQQCQPPSKCQTPEISPPTPCPPPVTSGCGSSSGGCGGSSSGGCGSSGSGGCGSSGSGGCGNSGSEGGCHLFSHHRRSHGHRHQGFDNSSGHSLLAGGCGGSSGGCSSSSGGCSGSSGGCC